MTLTHPKTSDQLGPVLSSRLWHYSNGNGWWLQCSISLRPTAYMNINIYTHTHAICTHVQIVEEGSASRYQSDLGHQTCLAVWDCSLISYKGQRVVNHSKSPHSPIDVQSSDTQPLISSESEITSFKYTVWVHIVMPLYTLAPPGFAHILHFTLHVIVSHQTCWASCTFTKCLLHNEKDYVTVHNWSSRVQSGNIAVWEKKNYHCTASHVSRLVLDVFACGLHPLVTVPLQPPYWIDLSLGPGDRTKWAEY